MVIQTATGLPVAFITSMAHSASSTARKSLWLTRKYVGKLKVCVRGNQCKESRLFYLDKRTREDDREQTGRGRGVGLTRKYADKLMVWVRGSQYTEEGKKKVH